MISSRELSMKLPQAMSWVGPGRTAFVGAAGESRCGRIFPMERIDHLQEAFGTGGDPEFFNALDAYFSAGGGPCLVLNLPVVDSIPPQNRIAVWLGDDGGPGYRTGIHSLLDLEEVGTIAAPGLLDPVLRRRLLGLLENWEQGFIVLDALPEGRVEDLPSSDRGAVAQGWNAGGGRHGLPPTGPLLAELELSDFCEERPDRAIRALSRGAHPTLGTRFSSVESWRFWEGLRRSVDYGTRWIVFEPNRELLWRRVEREVGAFLERLFRLGLLWGRTPQEAFRVRCGPPSGGSASGGLLVLNIEVKLKESRRCDLVHIAQTNRKEGVELKESS